ncbi:hypothetical protein A3D83_01680 [Candidatus Daviesbacteria bacterium RIFCSPHIGHO2_02_FULL_41_10]|uniref:FAD-binding FR-type domain-containing protein n=2 Tax=Candidatus Daviesiibacteriota TaxID=1752718 RepID=A0A1F5ISY3_9BACT|nr:MAG: hypothetical protein A2871_00385 [Candidatus Daviesbacteria bacterium RIFCSPHIGHO2_01_FULL_41_23]OGE32899.1 MAG: hypothetical protein A3D83_01680 [Candidatus Daviesbacteria bacterium RIFCSPHIGHO2_02_FULL_41_10]
MMKFPDNFLSNTTMYRLVLYVLVAFLAVAVALSALGILPFNPVAIVFSAAFLIAVCWVANTLFARIFRAQTNLESVYITALILALIMTPAHTFQDVLILGLIAVLSQGSKYILAIRKKHIFNPAAFGVLAGGLLLNHSASWWYGNIYLFPAVILGGLLIARKIKRLRMVGVFILSMVLIVFLQNPADPNFFQKAYNLVILSPLLFFSFIMLTEPLTSPGKIKFQLMYAILVALLFNIAGTITLISFPLELSLIIGNIFSYIMNSSFRYILKLQEKSKLNKDVFEFRFKPRGDLNFKAGQYMEWTFAHQNPDSRGVRRSFTIVSSPTEDFIAFASKFYDKPSTFKQALQKMQPGEKITAGELSGEFTLPKAAGKKLVFIAGGIGITPYRSMIKYLLDLNQKRDIILLYSNKLASDIVYEDVFDKAVKKLGIKVVYVLTDEANVPSNWKGKIGFIDAKMIAEEVPDLKERIFYISGPHSMVDTFEKILKDMGVSGKQIKTDFFPGYA